MSNPIINDITPNLGLALPHPANDADVDILRLRNMIQTLDAAVPTLLERAMGDALRSLQGELQALLNTVAPASSALSKTQWTNARAALLDRLPLLDRVDALISSRAPADTALSNTIWTEQLAAQLRRGADGGSPITQYTPSPVYRGSGPVPVPAGTRRIEALLCGGGGSKFGGVAMHEIPVLGPTMDLVVGAGAAGDYGGITSVSVHGTLYAQTGGGRLQATSLFIGVPFEAGGGGAYGTHGVDAWDRYYEQWDQGLPGSSLTNVGIWGLTGWPGGPGARAYQGSWGNAAAGGGAGGLLGPGGAASANKAGAGGDGGGGRGQGGSDSSVIGGNGFARFRFFF